MISPGLVVGTASAGQPPESVLAAHPETICTPDLVRALAEGLGVRAKLLVLAAGVAGRGGAVLLGRQAMWQSLAGDFVPQPGGSAGAGLDGRAETLGGIAARRRARYYNTTDANP